MTSHEKNKIIVSSCILGKKVRYNGAHAKYKHDFLDDLKKSNLLISCCPEILAGCKVPRLAAEISGGNGYDVIDGKAKILMSDGVDVTDVFMRGAKYVLDIAIYHNVKMAILKDKSPSCGSSLQYNGEFNGNIISGIGVLSALLIRNNIKVFNAENIEDAAKYYYKNS
jgi:uncharacterized protein YbbK (DUF523 family)